MEWFSQKNHSRHWIKAKKPLRLRWPGRLHPADHVGQLPPEAIECLPEPTVIETELLSASGALESLVAANPFMRYAALNTAVRAANASQIAMCEKCHKALIGLLLDDLIASASSGGGSRVNR
jgi:hypothetical protein